MNKPTHGKFQDLEGQRFGRLVVVEFFGRPNLKTLWRCRCDCGNESIAHATSLRGGKHKSCGCLHAEKITTHGHARTITYASWGAMKARCLNPKTFRYDRYGGRGITVCERWLTFENFLADMGERPSAAYTLDRIDGDGNYEPGNCRWATKRQQNRHCVPPKHTMRNSKGQYVA